MNLSLLFHTVTEKRFYYLSKNINLVSTYLLWYIVFTNFFFNLNSKNLREIENGVLYRGLLAICQKKKKKKNDAFLEAV